MIQQGYQINFETLRTASSNNDLALVECTDKKTGKPVIAICAIQLTDGEYNITPLAKMFDGNPYDELDPPK